MKFIRLLLICGVFVCAQPTLAATGESEYCQSKVEAAKAQADILRAPTVVAGVTQSPLVGSPAQGITGLTESVQSFRKGSALVRASEADCALFLAQENLKLAVQYTIPALEREALNNRLSVDYEALHALDEIVAKSTVLLDARSLPRQTVYALQADRARVLQDIAQINTTIAAIPDVPAQSNLQALIDDEARAEASSETAFVKLGRTSNFDVQLTAGIRHTISPILNNELGGYGGFTVTYSLGARNSDRHLAAAARAAGTWNQSETGGATAMAHLLQQQLRDALVAQYSRLAILHQQEQAIRDNSTAIAQVSSQGARSFRTSLDADEILIRIEVMDAQFRIAKLSKSSSGS
jgi:hypothetical protein